MKVVVLFLACFTIRLAAQTDSSSATAADTFITDSLTNHSEIFRINTLIKLAEKQLGYPYVYGGKKPGGFDCSGFVSYCFKTALNITLSPVATVYNGHGRGVSKADARPGDVICFNGYQAGTGVIGHVGIIYEVTPTDIYFIHSALNGGVRKDSLSLGYYSLRFMGIRRIVE